MVSSSKKLLSPLVKTTLSVYRCEPGLKLNVVRDQGLSLHRIYVGIMLLLTDVYRNFARHRHVRGFLNTQTNVNTDLVPVRMFIICLIAITRIPSYNKISGP